jgi:DNA-binding LytR/AlgR family response regulator
VANLIISNKSPLVVLNHRLNDGTGLEVVNHFSVREQRDFAFIYVGSPHVSGLREEVVARGALAYLEMPLDTEALRQALQQFLFDYGISSQVSPALLAAALAAPEPPEYISPAMLRTDAPELVPNAALNTASADDEALNLIIKHNGVRKEVFVRVEDILYCRAARNDLEFVTVYANEGAASADATQQQARIYRITATLKEYRQRLEPLGFVMAERSYLVNLRHIRLVEGKQIVLTNNQRLPIGDTYAKDLIDYFTRGTYAKKSGEGQK